MKDKFAIYFPNFCKTPCSGKPGIQGPKMPDTRNIENIGTSIYINILEYSISIILFHTHVVGRYGRIEACAGEQPTYRYQERGTLGIMALQQAIYKHKSMVSIGKLVSE